MTKAAIVDYGLGNLHSVRQACAWVGLEAEVTDAARTMTAADVIILPGVGAFGDAMAALRRRDLVGVLRDAAAAGTMLVGVCLGLQLLMEHSEEFGAHEGLGLIKGGVSRLEGRDGDGRPLKVPHIGWSGVRPPQGRPQAWEGTALQGVPPGHHFYFVHSFAVRPEDPAVVCSVTAFGDLDFCSSIQYNNIFACQFHPERSGREGLRIYRNIFDRAQRAVGQGPERNHHG